MANTIRRERPARSTNSTNSTDVWGPGWLGAVRWVPRDLREWVSQGGMRIEECREDGSLIIRAELPGVDPRTDVKVTATDDRLAIDAERREGSEEPGQTTYRSEFHYGRIYREIPLPPGVRLDRITATFDNGLLNVEVPLVGSDGPEAREIPIAESSNGGTGNWSGDA